ncbi:DEAD/DEAH box helicase [uncultured Parasutterella sp.]|uniref:helicase-related protein n=1 Tax=uncultured Parasutterella sp. TaxID=1263098 RepID=UPI002594E566|nr:DEAD/DEAH box helicase [uncultured Parasutterella sp.]
MNYKQFLKTKVFSIPPVGKRVDPSLVNPQLFQFQRDIVLWALQKGRAAIFAGTGLGKTLMQCEWARLVGERVIIFAPLAVSKQTVTEAAKFGITVHYCAEAADVCDGINITNYERLEKFDIRDFNAVVLDESSILKNMSGKLRTKLIDSCARIPYRLACTATPAPNDLMELCNHSEFLGIMTATEMLATFFTHDGGDTSKWRLKKHAVMKFWDWVASWAVMLTNPADIGYIEDGKRYILPPLRMHEHVVHSDDCSGFLFPMAAETLQERQQARRDSIKERSEKCAEVVMNDKENSQWIIWCNLNDEAEAIRKLIPGAVEIRGSDSSERKESAALGFASGEIKVLISKPLIFGMGLNFQRCHNMAFLGLSDSFEQYYQAVRRCWRFGQTHSVNVHIITDEREGAVVENIRRKESQFREMLAGMIASCQETNQANIKSAKRDLDDYKPKTTMTTPSWLTPAA